MDNAERRNIYTNVPSSQTFRPYLQMILSSNYETRYVIFSNFR
jgi:hypothetical protein